MDLQKLMINSPCTADWDEMSGDSLCKFCGDCEKNVHDLSAMSERKAQQLIQKESDLCVRFVRDGSGQISFQPETVRRSRWGRVARAGLGFALVSMAAACGTGSDGEGLFSRTLTGISNAVGWSGEGCSVDQPQPEMGEVDVVTETVHLMGMVAVEPESTPPEKPAPKMGKIRLTEN